MKNRTENSNYNEIFREKMDQLDFPYDNSQWVRLEKELDSSGISSMPGNSKSTFKIIGIIATGIAVILISGIIYFTNLPFN